MNAMTWFQARDLCFAERRAIRRKNWRKWLLLRKYAWHVEENGVERVAQNFDLTDRDYLAKDWTDEIWEGGTTPPCCTPNPAATQLAPNSTGGLASWAMPGEECGGAGQGGNVPVVATQEVFSPDQGGAGDNYGISMWYEDEDHPGETLVPDGPGGTWVAPPLSGVVLRAVLTKNGVPFVNNHYHYVMYVAPPGKDIAAVPPGNRVFPLPDTAGSGQAPNYHNLSAAPGFLRARFVPTLTDSQVYFGARLVPEGVTPMPYPAGSQQERDLYYSSPGYRYAISRQAGQEALVQVTPGQTWRAKAFFIHPSTGDFLHPNYSQWPVFVGEMVVPNFHSGGGEAS